MNRLSQEKSPYLLQHKDNPVDWYAWGDEAFQAARSQNKPIFLSIGYATCHWCHVMEHDSFEKAEVAEILNRHFISIKVDREERPDVDQVFMEAVVALTGRGGWPMSVFLTPDLKPFFGGTFFWKDQFKALLGQIAHLWEHDRPKIDQSVEEIVGHLAPSVPSAPLRDRNVDPQILDQALISYQHSFDPEWGGFGGAPKFPKATDLSFLLRLHHRIPVGATHASPLHMVELTLQKMAWGGMYDHLMGGFARYSTDEKWLVPHFEKMLYDNALLSVTYLEAFQVTGKPVYAQIAREILDYVLTDMTSPEGGFYSAEDADSEGEEGKFAIWLEEEIDSALTPEEAELFKKVYGVTPQGNFEHGTNILNLQPEYGWEIKNDPLIRSATQKLQAVRRKRIPPLKDDKILVDWNGLMITAMAKGYQVLGDGRYLQAAQKAAAFIQEKLGMKNDLLRRWREGEARFSANAADFSFLIEGLLGLASTDFDPRWKEWAALLQQKQNELFWDETDGAYFLSRADQSDLFLRKKDLQEGATPSANSVAVGNLFRLGDRPRAERLLAHLAPFVRRYPPAFSKTLLNLHILLYGDLPIGYSCQGGVCEVSPKLS